MQRIRVAEWSFGEYRDLLVSLACGNQNRGPELLALKSKLEKIYVGRPLFLVNRARHALQIALRTFAETRPGRSEVIFPAYICPSVIEAIEHAGLIPVAADIRSDLNIDPCEVRAKLSSRTLAVVVAHMYGCPAAIEEIDEFCQRRGVFLVDDAAQLAGISVGGRPAGCFGNCGLVSFSLSKTIVAGTINAGGFLIVNDPSLEIALQRRWSELPQGRYSVRDFLSFIAQGPLYTRIAPVAYYAQQIRHRFILAETRDNSRDCPARCMANANAIVALPQLDNLASRVSGRILVLAAYRRELARSEIATMPQFAPERYLTRVMVMLRPGVDVQQLRRRLYLRGVQTRLGYGIHPRYAGHMIHAASASARLLELPSHSRMMNATIERIVRRLAAY